MSNKSNLTEQDFVFNGRKDWNTFYRKQYLKENIEIEDESLKHGFTKEQIAKKHNISMEEVEKQWSIGVNDEKTHTNDSKEIDTIVSQHLWEKPDFYTVSKQAGLEESKKKSIIRPDFQRAAPEQNSSALASQAAGPGTTSPTQGSSGGAVATMEENIQLKNYPKNPFTAQTDKEKQKCDTIEIKPEDLPHNFKTQSPTQTLELAPVKNTPSKNSFIQPKTSLIKNPKPSSATYSTASVKDTAEQYIRAGEAAGLDGMTLEGHSFILDHLHELTPKQQERFEKINSMLEESKKHKGSVVGQGSPRNDGTSTTKPSRQVHSDKRKKEMEIWKKNIHRGDY